MQPRARSPVPLSQRTSEGVARILRDQIFSGARKPGEPLRERALAEELDVSRTPVREALFTLHSEGLVELSPNRGATVRTITTHEIVQIYSLRVVLEAYAAREAATNRAHEDLNALVDAEQKLERLIADGSPGDQALADLAFHQLIGEATGARMLQTTMERVLAFTVSFRSNYRHSHAHAQTVIEHHERLIQALRDQDPDVAERIMREHVECSKRFALEHFDESDHVVVP